MKLKVALSAIALASATVALANPVNAAYGSAPSELPPDDSDVVYTPVTPTTDKIFIDGEPTDIAVMPDFEPTAPVIVFDDTGQPMPLEDLSIVSVDGSVTALSVVSATDRSTLASCWYGWVAPGTATWYTSVPGCSVIGISPEAVVGYSWTVDFKSLGSACLKGRGYVARHLPGGGNTYDEYYPSLGCGSSGASGGGVVKWGEVASNKAVQMMATSSPVGAAGMFS